MYSRCEEINGRASDASSVGARKLSQLPLRKRVLFIGILLLLPLCMLGLLEGALRLAGFGGYPPTFREVGRTAGGSSLIFTDVLGPNSYFFASRSQGLALDPVAFEMPKPEGTIRIMWVGGSAAKGIPQPRALRGSAFLKVMLEDLWPGRDVEVINVGTPGIASYPVLGITTEALDYEPDLVVAYLGNNEFYGAYGVTSLHAAGRSPAMLRVTRGVRSTAIAQAMDQVLRGRVVRDPATLMEAMVGQSSVGPGDPVRGAAAANLRSSVVEIVERCRARGVPVIVCTPPCNEVGMGPLGEADLSGLAEHDAVTVDALLSQARLVIQSDPPAAEESLRQVLAIEEQHATAHHLLARVLAAQGRHDAAATAFQIAVDLDPMPWRAPTSSIEAIRDGAQSSGAVLVDLVKVFRERSETGAVGWDLIEDHVHPSLRGQVLVARSVVRGMTELANPLAPDPSAVEALPGWRSYAERQGANDYTRWAVAYTMTRLGGISFFERSTPEMRGRNARLCAEIETGEHPRTIGQLRRWADPRSEMVDRFPISGLVAEVKLKAGQYAEASRLYQTAATNSIPYGSRRVAFTYFALYSERKVAAELSAESVAMARAMIDEGRFLIDSGWSTSGQAERFVGQLHQLLGDDETAIPFRIAARRRVSGGHIIATDEALVRAYVATGRAKEAKSVVERGLQGESAATYMQMASLIPTPG